MDLAPQKLAPYLLIINMDKNQIYIIGGGITGLATSNLIQNSNVTLLEASKTIGGVLRDLQYQENCFFSGCQYINQSLFLFEDYGLKNEFYEFNHLYASYTDLFGEKTTATDFSGPVFGGRSLDIETKKSLGIFSISDRCDLYPREIGIKLKNWFSYIGVDVYATHHSSVVGFQASRVYVKNDISKILLLKQKNQQVDMLFGAPRSLIGLADIRASLPVEGFSKTFDKILKSKNRNTNIQTRTTVNCQRDGNKVVLKTKNGVIRPDVVIWTADPTKILASIFNKKIDSLRFNAEIITGFLNGKLNNPFYIQVYSMKSKVLRIYVYNINGQSCYTIEKAYDRQLTADVLSFSQKILKEFTNFKLGPALMRENNVRYFAYSIKDHIVLESLRKQKKINNLICPDYLSYGRDQKIKSINDQLKGF